MRRSAATIIAIAMGCGGDAGHVEIDGGADAGPDAVADAAPSPADASPDGLPPVPEEVLSNLPVPWEAAPMSSPYIALVSANYQERFGSPTFKYWYSEVRNLSMSPACFVRLRLRLEDADGAALLELDTYADAAQHDGPGLNQVACIPPGGLGAALATDIYSDAVPLERVARAVYRIDTHLYNTAIPALRAPRVASARPVQTDDGRWAIAGELVADGGDITSVIVSVYTIDARGLITERLVTSHGGPMLGGETWAYQTIGMRVAGDRAERWYQFVGYDDAPPRQGGAR